MKKEERIEGTQGLNGFSPEVNRIVDNFTLMDDDFMSKVFDENIPATQLLLSIILK